MSERTRSCQEMTPEDEEWLVDAPGPEVWAGLPRSRWEDGDLLRRLDDWREGEDAGPLIRWAAVHLRGCKNEGGDPSATALVSGAPQLDASALSSQKQRKPNTPGWVVSQFDLARRGPRSRRWASVYLAGLARGLPEAHPVRLPR